MGTKLQGLLSGGFALMLLLGASCAGAAQRSDPGPIRPVDTAVEERPRPSAPQPEFPRRAVRERSTVAEGYGPGILRPTPDAGDQEVARVGALVLRQSHAFARLRSADPETAQSAVELLVFDVLVAQHAEQFGIRVDPELVEARAAGEERGLREQVERELADEIDFAGYVRRMFGMELSEWRRSLRIRTAQRLYRGYVIRYLALREDRVRARYLAHRDRSVVAEAVGKVREGADFATLALRLSEEGRRNGGLLPPFGRRFPHPVTKVAFSLDKGQVSDPFVAEVRGQKRWYAVYVLDRFSGRDVPFAEVRDEIDRDLQANPLTRVETQAYALLWGATDSGEDSAGADGR